MTRSRVTANILIEFEQPAVAEFDDPNLDKTNADLSE